MISIRSTLSVFIVSAIGGLVGCLFVATLHALTSVLGPDAHGSWTHIAVMCGAGIAVAMLKHCVGNPGDINLLVDNIHLSGGRANRAEIRSLIPTSLICIASGGAMGPEAPLVQTTAAIGTAIGQKQNADTNRLRVLTISGMATGFALLFGAPIGAAIFSLELMHRRGFEYYEAFIPAMTGALIGYTVNAGILGVGLTPIWSIGSVEHLSVADIFWGGVGGLFGAGLGALFVFLVRVQKRVFSRCPEWLVPVVGGVALGFLGLWNPYALTYGEFQLVDLFSGSLLIPALLAAGAAKMLATSLTLSSGWKGGFIIPLFFIGAAFSQVVPHAVPGWPHALVFSLATMVGINASVTKTPIGSALVVCGMCGLPALAPCLIAGLASLYVSDRMVLLTAQRNRLAT